MIDRDDESGTPSSLHHAVEEHAAMPGHDPKMPRPGTHRQAAYRLALGMLLCAVLWWSAPASVALAQDAPEPASIKAASGSVMQHSATHTSTNLWIYLMAMGCALVLGGLYMIRRARHVQSTRLLTPEDLAALERPREQEEVADTEHHELQALAKALARNTSGELGALAVESELGSPLFALRSEGPQRECPKCRRRFASWMAICPFDHASLQEPGHTHVNVRKMAARRAKASREDLLPRKRCLLCERRYNEDVTYCTHDGEQLIQDLREEAEEAESWQVCRCCGEDARVSAGALACGCSEEDQDLLILNPSLMKHRGMPMSVCPTCRSYGSPGQTHCAEHGELLLPESVFERHALSARGHGTGRKLCTRCHKRFSGAYTYCPHDAQRLTHID